MIAKSDFSCSDSGDVDDSHGGGAGGGGYDDRSGGGGGLGGLGGHHGGGCGFSGGGFRGDIGHGQPGRGEGSHVGGGVHGGHDVGGNVSGHGFGDYFIGIPTCDKSLAEHQTYISLGQMLSELMGSEGLDAKFGGSHFFDEISMIMQEDELARRRSPIVGSQARVDVDLNEPPSGPMDTPICVPST
ncbi:uncharacterized protein LOC107461678 [Arachis duranensis]|uniref:Uncharacterized protein LOC107461678 n=1 Tax=Arachis duranensis TaxID=130453 RepID=A0A6P4B8V1_ARADU|nr:uncharacterized protein LOC107461678 [Arachis duranensis]